MQIAIDIDDNLYTRLFDTGVDNYDDAVDMAKAIRNGTPLPKGHWVTEDGNKKLKSLNKAKRCSNCNFRHLALRHYDYCPNCGADMRGE